MDICPVTGAKIDICCILTAAIIVVFFLHHIHKWHRINIYLPIKRQWDNRCAGTFLCLECIFSDKLDLIILFKYNLFQFSTAFKRIIPN